MDGFLGRVEKEFKSEEGNVRAVDDYFLGELFGCDEARLKEEVGRNISFELDRESRLMTVTTYGASKIQAQQLNYAWLKSVEVLHCERIDNRRREAMVEFDRKIDAQEKKVEALRKKLYVLSKKAGVSVGEGEEKSDYAKIKRERDQLESFLDSLESLDDGDLIVMIIASGRGDLDGLKSDYDQYSVLFRKRAEVIAGGEKKDDIYIEALDVRIEDIGERLLAKAKVEVGKLRKDLAQLNDDVRLFQVEPLERKGVLEIERKRFDAAREEYERELCLYDSIKGLISTSEEFPFLRDPLLKYNKVGWSRRVALEMEKRKKGE